MRANEGTGVSEAMNRGRQGRPRTPVPPVAPLPASLSLAEGAASSIRENILDGVYQQGQHLVETELAKQLGVSRGPVREALKVLSLEGLVAIEPHRGVFVVRLTELDVWEIYELRAAIESRAAALMAQQPQAEKIDLLREQLASLEASAQEGDVSAVARGDLKFHELLCELSGVGRLHATFVQNVPVMRTLFDLDQRLYSSLSEIAEQHRPLLEVISAGDAEAAAAAAIEHCENASATSLTYLAALRVARQANNLPLGDRGKK